MIILYDLLLLDDVVCATLPYDQRRRRLESIVRRTPGRTDIGAREKIKVGLSDAVDRLRRSFARAIAQC